MIAENQFPCTMDVMELDYNDSFGIAVFEFSDNKLKFMFGSSSYFSFFSNSKEEYLSAVENKYGIRFCDESQSKRIVESICENMENGNSFVLSFPITHDDGAFLDVRLELNKLSSSNNSIALLCFVYSNGNDRYKNIKYDSLNEIASISIDSIFDYSNASNTMKHSIKVDGEFNNHLLYDNYEKQIIDKKYVHIDDIDTFKEFCSDLRLGKSKFTYEIRFFDNIKERYFWSKVDGKTVFNDKGKPLHSYGTINDIDDVKTNELRLFEKAQRDPLTGIYNKAVTEEKIRQSINKNNGIGMCAFILIDIDNFKQLNDNLGHLFGDTILKDISMEMRSMFRFTDVVGRIGGDEFIVFMQGGITQRRQIERKAKEICQIFKSIYSGENSKLQITGSIGISIYPDDGKTFEELYNKADLALYEAKNLGKNGYEFYDISMDNGADVFCPNRYTAKRLIDTGENTFQMDITDFAFDILDKTTDVTSAINLLLSKVGRQYGISEINVSEVIDNTPYTTKQTYSWSNGKIGDSDINKVTVFSEHEWITILSAFDVNDVICCSDIDNLQFQNNDLDFLQGSYSRAFLQCAMYELGEYRGNVIFYDSKKKRMWTFNEVKELKLICKIISSYLVRLRSYEQAEFSTNYDKLTKFPRISRFKELVPQIINNSLNEKYAIVYTDIDNFKYINEKYGYETGNLILQGISEFINVTSKCCKLGCRVFADRFVYLFTLVDRISFVELIDRVNSKFVEAYRHLVPGHNLVLNSGICVLNDNSQNLNVNLAIDNANIARKLQKYSADNHCMLFNDAMRLNLNSSIEIINSAENAIINKEFVVYFQPKISLKENKIVGAEALVRWKKTNGQIIPPNEFIPSLEKNGYIVYMDFYIYEEVCKYIRNCLDLNKEIVPISVNVSRAHLKDLNFTDKLIELVDKYEIPHEMLEFELTESVFLDSERVAVGIMNELREHGFMVSIDDFGAGFSSLNLLKNLPVDILKLDKDFFGNDSIKKNDEIVISSIIEMAHKMNIIVICEGVETNEQVSMLKNTFCNLAQGFLFAKPMPMDDFDHYIGN